MTDWTGMEKPESGMASTIQEESTVPSNCGPSANAGDNDAVAVR